MNGTPKNRNVAPPKQINRVAAPISVNPNNVQQQPQNIRQEQGPVKQINRVAAPQQVNGGQSSLSQLAQNQTISGKPVKQKVIKEHDASTMIFVVILLIILACMAGFICYVILPRIEASKNKIEFNDSTTEPRTAAPVYPSIQSIELNNGTNITTTGEYPINQKFTLTTVNNGEKLDVSINGVKVTETSKVFSTVGVVDDTIILVLADGDIRQNRLAIYDISGREIAMYDEFGDKDGLLLLNEKSGYIFNRNNLVVITSRMYNRNVITTGGLGVTEGTDVCNFEELESKNIGNDFIVMANYSISYQGDNKYSTPINITNITIQEYRGSNDTCQ